MSIESAILMYLSAGFVLLYVVFEIVMQIYLRFFFKETQESFLGLKHSILFKIEKLAIPICFIPFGLLQISFGDYLLILLGLFVLFFSFISIYRIVFNKDNSYF